ncbi:putative zinc-binding metallopeptidase [Ensifer sp. ZNC0028]|uniref:putative zinc-binding metallopeptidase n=1 Tax=Ensifer sp. ZNC0028 TaxID=1339236 RepID=UPI001FD94407|nr:putative zinc-binding metallopeptidase [Ensifer sp. ZNC0028]
MARVDVRYAPLPANWQDSFISAYASSDPFEDIAKSPAHLFHIVDAAIGPWVPVDLASNALLEPWASALRSSCCRRSS